MYPVTVKNVSKKFRIPHQKKTTLFQNMLGLIRRQTTYEQFWALKDISFDVSSGETFGILGRNGSGKSTLLKILARVLYPDVGSTVMLGKIAPFLELGVGFQVELTASENVYLYASILGISRREASKIYDQIFDFAELKRFENMRLKNFSSGMYLRLAFSVALFSNPDIMLVDEVLAVGDDNFQKKCLTEINKFKSAGKTIVFVSHDLGMVRLVCDRAMLLDAGKQIMIDTPDRVIDHYLRAAG